MITNYRLHAEILGDIKTDRSPKTRTTASFRTLRYITEHTAYHTGSEGSAFIQKGQ